jgi:hypothetical protein
MCDPINGVCVCKSGFKGTTCQDKCPDGYYGEGCKREFKIKSINYEFECIQIMLKYLFETSDFFTFCVVLNNVCITQSSKYYIARDTC